MKKTWKIDIDCPNCAAKVERALQKLPGVVSVSVNYVQKKITLEAPADRFEEVRKAAYAKMKEIEPDAEIFFDDAEKSSDAACPCGGHHHEDDDDDEDYDDEDEWDDDEDSDEGFEFGDEETTIYEAECPSCGEVVDFDEETLEKGSIVCPNCGETLEFSLEDEEE